MIGHLLTLVLQADAQSGNDIVMIIGAVGTLLTVVIGGVAAAFVKLFAMVREAQNGVGEKRQVEVRSDISELKTAAVTGFEKVTENLREVSKLQQQSHDIQQEMLLAIRGGAINDAYTGKERRT